jgi:hypothetical protein
VSGLARDAAARYLPGMQVPGLRSCYDKVGGVFYVGRMFDKVRLHAAGKLPEDYHANLGQQFDGRVLSFLSITYDALIERVKAGGSDQEILDWCFETGRHPRDEEIEIWNAFMRKRGWRDDGTPVLLRRLKEIHCEHRTDVQTSFDFIELDEGRDPAQRGGDF